MGLQFKYLYNYFIIYIKKNSQSKVIRQFRADKKLNSEKVKLTKY
jgi:hypothetical protein